MIRHVDKLQSMLSTQVGITSDINVEVMHRVEVKDIRCTEILNRRSINLEGERSSRIRLVLIPIPVHVHLSDVEAKNRC